MEYDDEIVRVDKYWTMDSLVIEERQPKRPKTGFTKHTHTHTHNRGMEISRKKKSKARE